MAQQSQAELKAAVWLDGARKSIQAKEFDIAVSQFEKGLTLMPGDGASNQEISKVKAEYGGALESDGQWEEALTVWRELADSDPEALAQASRVEKALRREASALLEKSQKHLQEGELTRAEQAATEAHRLLTSFGGADAAIALSLQRLAQVHIELGRPVKAESELKQAQRLAYTLEREELLSTLAPKASKKVDRPAAVRPKRAAVRKPPSLGEPDSIPKATAKARATNSETQPVRRRRMVEIPAARPPSDDEAESDLPLGQRDVVKGYRNSR